MLRVRAGCCAHMQNLAVLLFISDFQHKWLLAYNLHIMWRLLMDFGHNFFMFMHAVFPPACSIMRPALGGALHPTLLRAAGLL